jgi:uncharacterized Tic20 family protein
MQQSANHIVRASAQTEQRDLSWITRVSLQTTPPGSTVSLAHTQACAATAPAPVSERSDLIAFRSKGASVMSDPSIPPQPADDGAHQAPGQPAQQPPVAGQQPPQYAQQPQYAAPAEAGPLTPEQDKSYAMWSHLGGAVSFLALFTGWLALLAIIPSLVFYLSFGKRGERVRHEAKEALNFQITMVGAMIVWAIVAAILYAVLFVPLLFGGGWFVLGLILALVGWALVVIDVVFSIVAGLRVNAGGSYRYPFAIRFIK